jgi:hypothetical protein
LKALPVFIQACDKFVVLCGACTKYKINPSQSAGLHALIKIVMFISGKTYCSRLWCIWELCKFACQSYVPTCILVALTLSIIFTILSLDTLFVFAPKNSVAGRLQLEELEGGNTDVPTVLKQFQLQGCHCYDPNEEHKIRSIIKECGKESFEGYIRDLGNQIA